MSTMLMESYGKQSSTKRKKHIRVQYFFIMDRIENGYLSLKFCPTGEMYTDFFTNQIQGATFWRFWDMIQGIPESTSGVDMSCPRATAKVTSQECVGYNNRHTRRTDTASTDDRRGTLTDAHGILCMDTQKYEQVCYCKHVHG